VENNSKDNKKEFNPFLKYSGIGMQLMITICIGVWLGMKIDNYLHNKQPWAAILCSLSFMIVGLVMFIRSLPKV
jgi:F0F1-type ATP synthase assembly protein I